MISNQCSKIVSSGRVEFSGSFNNDDATITISSDAMTPFCLLSFENKQDYEKIPYPMTNINLIKLLNFKRSFSVVKQYGLRKSLV